MGVMGAHVRLERKVEQLAVEVLVLVINWHIFVLVHGREEWTRSAESVPRMVEVGGDGMRRGAVGRGGECGPLDWWPGGGRGVQQQGRGVVDVCLSGEPSNWVHLRGKMIILTV